MKKEKMTKIEPCGCNYCRSVRYPWINGAEPEHKRNARDYHALGYEGGKRCEFKNNKWIIYNKKDIAPKH